MIEGNQSPTTRVNCRYSTVVAVELVESIKHRVLWIWPIIFLYLDIFHSVSNQRVEKTFEQPIRIGGIRRPGESWEARKFINPTIFRNIIFCFGSIIFYFGSIPGPPGSIRKLNKWFREVCTGPREVFQVIQNPIESQDWLIMVN